MRSSQPDVISATMPASNGLGLTLLDTATPSAHPEAALARIAGRAVTAIAARVTRVHRRWQRHRARAHTVAVLRALDERALRDIGIDRRCIPAVASGLVPHADDQGETNGPRP